MKRFTGGRFFTGLLVSFFAFVILPNISFANTEENITFALSEDATSYETFVSYEFVGDDIDEIVVPGGTSMTVIHKDKYLDIEPLIEDVSLSYIDEALIDDDILLVGVYSGGASVFVENSTGYDDLLANWDWERDSWLESDYSDEVEIAYREAVDYSEYIPEEIFAEEGGFLFEEIVEDGLQEDSDIKLVADIEDVSSGDMVSLFWLVFAGIILLIIIFVITKRYRNKNGNTLIEDSKIKSEKNNSNLASLEEIINKNKYEEKFDNLQEKNKK